MHRFFGAPAAKVVSMALLGRGSNHRRPNEICIYEQVCVYTYKLDGHLLVVEKIGTLKDDTEGAFANLFSHSVVHAHDV